MSLQNRKKIKSRRMLLMLFSVMIQTDNERQKVLCARLKLAKILNDISCSRSHSYRVTLILSILCILSRTGKTIGDIR
jgi:hypothetical protein